MLYYYRSAISKKEHKFNSDELVTLLELYPKNYQLWRYISEHADDYSITKLVNFALKMDPKNYHAWETLIERPSLSAFGTDLSRSLLQNDKDNNSARNYLMRFNVI